MPETDIAVANTIIDQLRAEAVTNKSAFDSLSTAHTSNLEQQEITKTNLVTSEASVKQLTEASKTSTKSLEDLQQVVTERDTTIATHAETITAYTTLKAEYEKLQETIVTAQKERLKAVGIGDELLVDKDTAALASMELTVAAVRQANSNGTTTNPNGTGLTGGGDGQTPVGGGQLGPLENELEAVKRAKEKAGVKVS